MHVRIRKLSLSLSLALFLSLSLSLPHARAHKQAGAQNTPVTRACTHTHAHTPASDGTPYTPYQTSCLLPQADQLLSTLLGSVNADQSEAEVKREQAAKRKQHQEMLEERANARILATAKSADDFGKLRVVQLKSILKQNYIEHDGCVEKQELVTLVVELWEVRQKEEAAPKAEICKVCMDQAVRNETCGGRTITHTRCPCAFSSISECMQQLMRESILCARRCICPFLTFPSLATNVINAGLQVSCVFLECGHFVCCSDCGKQVEDCPICRQPITRVVPVFRS